MKRLKPSGCAGCASLIWGVGKWRSPVGAALETAKGRTSSGHLEIAFLGDESRCESCGECVARCPVGALMAKNAYLPTP